jgi:putative protease
LENLRIERYRENPHERKPIKASSSEKTLDYRGNVANQHAKDFYRRHGVEQIEDAFELIDNHRGKTLMTTKYCIKHQYNMCSVKQRPSGKWKEPLFLRDNRHCYRLEFDCRACEMKVSLI